LGRLSVTLPPEQKHDSEAVGAAGDAGAKEQSVEIFEKFFAFLNIK